MNEHRIRVFFYGSFINRDVLKEGGVDPAEVDVARLAGYDIRIEPLANLVRSDSNCVYGIVADVTHEELGGLYAQDWVGDYRPEPVVVDTLDGRFVPALCYIAPPREAHPADTDYIDRIVGPAKEYRFPRWYVDRIERWRSYGRDGRSP